MDSIDEWLDLKSCGTGAVIFICKAINEDDNKNHRENETDRNTKEKEH